MKKLLLYFFLLIVGVYPDPSYSQSAFECIDLQDLHKYITKSMKEWRIPGLSIAVVKNDTVIYSRGFGVRDVNNGEPVDENTIFAIASNTKAFTASALAILTDEGKISWDDRVVDYLPYFELYDPYVTREMRIRDLLCHRSGLETFSGDLLWYGSAYSREEVIRRARFLEPAYGFRYHFGYSNIMFLTAGEIIPAVEGVSWDDFLKEHFFIPFEMNRTTTSIKDFKSMDNIAMPHYVKIESGESQTIPYINWDNIGPAGSINSTAADMAKWIKFQLDMGKWDGQQVISEENIREMRTEHTILKVERWSELMWPTMHFSGYGLGWSLKDYHGRKVIGHGGGADGMISNVTMVPEENLGFVILTNSINSLPTALSYRILDMYFNMEGKDWSDLFLKNYLQGQKNAQKEKEEFINQRLKNTKPSLGLEAYTGKYGGKMYGNAEVDIDKDHLVVKFIPTPIFTGDLSHWHLDVFCIKLRDIPSLPEGTVQFILNPDGKVEEMKIDIPNPDFDFTELEFKKIAE